MNRKLKLGLFVLMLIVAFGLARHYKDALGLEALQQTLEHDRPLGPFVFIFIYVLSVVLMLPGSAMTILGGLLFGPIWGTLYNLLAATLGATLAFWMARHLGGTWMRDRLPAGKLKTLISGVEKEGWKFIAVVRLIPLLPFNLLNYALGLTRVKLRTYAIASALFMLPGCFAYTYLGVLGLAAIQGQTKEIITKGFIALGIFVFLSVLPWLIKQWKKN